MVLISPGPWTHFKGLKSLLLLDVFHARIALLLEVLSLLLIQQASPVQECCIAFCELRRKTSIHATRREREKLGKPVCLVIQPFEICLSCGISRARWLFTHTHHMWHTNTHHTQKHTTYKTYHTTHTDTQHIHKRDMQCMHKPHTHIKHTHNTYNTQHTNIKNTHNPPNTHTPTVVLTAI